MYNPFEGYYFSHEQHVPYAGKLRRLVMSDFFLQSGEGGDFTIQPYGTVRYRK